MSYIDFYKCQGGEDILSACPQYPMQELLELGALYLNSKRCTQNQNLQKNDILRIHHTPKRYPLKPQEWPQQIIANHQDFVVIHKPCQIPSHPTLDNWQENALIATQNYLNQKLYPCHRLDQATEGLLILGKNKTFASQFSQKNITKKYLAASKDHIPVGKYVHYMQKSDRAPKILSEHKIQNSQICELIIRKCQASRQKQKYIYEIELLTGRTHQIRAQMAKLGAPIEGDKIYGDAASEDLQLKAYFLAWEEFEFSLEFPAFLP